MAQNCSEKERIYERKKGRDEEEDVNTVATREDGDILFDGRTTFTCVLRI